MTVKVKYPERDAAIVEAYVAGEGAESVGARFGITESAVFYVLRREGVPRHPPGLHLSKPKGPQGPPCGCGCGGRCIQKKARYLPGHHLRRKKHRKGSTHTLGPRSSRLDDARREAAMREPLMIRQPCGWRVKAPAGEALKASEQHRLECALCDHVEHARSSGAEVR
jgi:hypothetical protein